MNPQFAVGNLSPREIQRLKKLWEQAQKCSMPLMPVKGQDASITPLECIGDSSRVFAENEMLRFVLIQLRDVHDPHTDPWDPDRLAELYAQIRVLLGEP